MGIYVREDRGGRLYLDIYQKGQRRHEALPLRLGDDPKENRQHLRVAEQLRMERERELALAADGFIDPKKAAGPLLDYAKKKADGRGAGDHVARLIKYLEGYDPNISLKSVNPEWLDGFKKYLLTCKVPARSGAKETTEKNLSPQSASHMYKALVQVLTLAVRDRVILRNPAESLKGITVPEKLLDYLDIEELEKLNKTPIPQSGPVGEEIRTAFFFAVYSGLRVSDVKGLQWRDVDRVKKQIQKVMKKTKRVVIIPLVDQALALIETPAIPNRESLVFPLLADTGIDTNKVLLKWAARAGILKTLGWHVARRSCATRLQETGADITTIKRILGHSPGRDKVTLGYAQDSGKQTREAIERAWAGIWLQRVYSGAGIRANNQSPDKAKREAVNGLPAIGIE
ncbi:phage integrase family site specific recombinase [Spirochaetia bacterium]|nr:phage integrase family site specific recombinase [Spirochaetia bacterium]